MTRGFAAATAVIMTLAGGVASAAPVDPAKPPAQSREPLAPVVLACVDRKGELVSTEIVQSSGIPEVDEAALKVARAAKFKPGENAVGAKKRKSCLKFKVKFVLQDGVPVPAQDAAPVTAGA
jgi:TonB family protein